MTAHHFTVDVEEYFHPTAMAPHYPMAGWDRLERRSPAVIERLLTMLAGRGVEGTFFIVGWLAEQEPAMVRAIAYSRALRIEASDLEALYRRDAKSYSLVVLNVAREMSRRLRVADALLADMSTAPLAR